MTRQEWVDQVSTVVEYNNAKIYELDKHVKNLQTTQTDLVKICELLTNVVSEKINPIIDRLNELNEEEKI